MCAHVEGQIDAVFANSHPAKTLNTNAAPPFITIARVVAPCASP